MNIILGGLIFLEAVSFNSLALAIIGVLVMLLTD